MCTFMRSIRSFLRHEEGSLIPAMASMMIVMIGAVGVAVDMGRLHLVQNRLSSALDAAGLAAGASTGSNAQSVASNYMALNYPNGYMGSTLGDVNATVSTDNMIINLTASATLQTTFLNVLGIS